MTEPTLAQPAAPYADFLTITDRLFAHLEELRWIDEMLDLHAQVEANHELSALDSMTLSSARYSVTLGHTHPFEREFMVVVPPHLVANKLQLARSNATAWAETSKRSLLSTLEPFACASPTMYATAHSGVVQAADEIQFVRDDFAELADLTGHWVGPAAHEFSSGFYERTQAVRDNQLLVLNLMRSGIAFAEGVTNMCNHSIMNALNAADECALKQLKSRAQEVERGSIAEVFAILSAATGLLALLPTPAEPLLAGSSIALGYASTHLEPEDEEPNAIEATYVDEIDQQLHSRLHKIRERSNHHFGALDQFLSRVESRIDEYSDGRVWFTQAPNLIDGPQPGDFFHTSSSRND